MVSGTMIAVAASIVKEQDEIRLQIRTLINDPDAKDLAQHRASLGAHKRMSRWVDQGEPLCRICRELLLQDTTPTPLCTLPRVSPQNTTSILPPPLRDVWPRILEHLLQRTGQLRRLFERVDRILTPEVCAKTVFNVLWGREEAPPWAAMIASGLRDSTDLQRLLEMMFSDIHGCIMEPTSAWHKVLTEAAAIRGWPLPAIRTWGDYDLSDGEVDEEDEVNELVERIEGAGFRAQLLRRPYHTPEINPDTVMVVNQLGRVEGMDMPFHRHRIF